MPRSMSVLRVLCVAGLLVLPAVAIAAEQSELPKLTRTDSLELPGLTAGCHVCEWRPKPNQMPAADQCGTDDAGVARVGQFECGFSQDCKRECHFVQCAPQ